MTTVIIPYSEWLDGQFVVVRDVPMRQCEAMQHQFMPVQTAKALETLLQRHARHAVQPIEILQVPVLQLESSSVAV